MFSGRKGLRWGIWGVDWMGVLDVHEVGKVGTGSGRVEVRVVGRVRVGEGVLGLEVLGGTGRVEVGRGLGGGGRVWDGVVHGYLLYKEM